MSIIKSTVKFLIYVLQSTYKSLEWADNGYFKNSRQNTKICFITANNSQRTCCNRRICALVSDKAYGCKIQSAQWGEQSTVLPVVMSVLKALIAVITVLIVLQINGINIGSMVAGLGLVSAAVGLALQDTLKDVVMGLHIMGDKFFSVGDPVEYNGVNGIVTSFNVRTTKIESITDNSTLSVCNRNISEIKKMTDMLDIDIPVSYDEDIRTFIKCLQRLPRRYQESRALQAASIKARNRLRVRRCFIKSGFIAIIKEDAISASAAIAKIQEELEVANIKIPFDQLDVHNV